MQSQEGPATHLIIRTYVMLSGKSKSVTVFVTQNPPFRCDKGRKKGLLYLLLSNCIARIFLPGESLAIFITWMKFILVNISVIHT